MTTSIEQATAESRTTPRAASRSAGSGSFSVPKAALKELVQHDMSAAAICAYLIICAFTDQDGEHSTVGLKGIFTRLNVCRDSAQKLVRQLVDLGLIFDRRPKHGEGESARRAVRFQVHTFDEPRDEQAWFCMSLVGPGTDGKLCNCPISRLKRLSDACVYTFVWLHAEQDDRTMSVRLPYESHQRPGATYIYDYQHSQGGEWFDESAGNRVVGYAQEKQLVTYDVPGKCEIDESLGGLMAHGFIYESIVVIDRPIITWRDQTDPRVDDDASFQFTVWTPKAGAATLMEVEKGLALNQRETWDSEDKACIFGEAGRFQRTYQVASPRGMKIAVVGLIRLRYRVHNARNLHVSEGWSRLRSLHDSYVDWMDRVKQHYL